MIQSKLTFAIGFLAALALSFSFPFWAFGEEPQSAEPQNTNLTIQDRLEKLESKFGYEIADGGTGNDMVSLLLGMEF